MPSSPRSATPVCLVIRWPRGLAPQSGPAQLLRRLVEDHLPATWGVEAREQLATFDGVSPSFVETALFLPKTTATTVSDAIADGLHRFEAAGRAVATLCVDAELPRGQVERQLAQQGVGAIVTGAASEAAAIRPLPFGVWQMEPAGTLPSQRRWFRRVGGVPQDFFSTVASPMVASVDLAAVGATESRGWRELEKAIDQAATAVDRGQIRMATVADLTAELARQGASRPQRSILRAA